MLYTDNSNYEDCYDRRRSSGVAKAGLATGTVGAALGALGLLGNMGNAAANAMNANRNGEVECSDNCCINRYEARLMHENMLLKAQAEHGNISSETDRKLLELYKYVVENDKDVNQKLADQRVVNEHNSCMIDGLTDAMKRQREEIYTLVSNEAAQRNNADARIVDYANCHFVPQVICGVACDPATAYRKGIFNPFSCNCGQSMCGTNVTETA